MDQPTTAPTAPRGETAEAFADRLARNLRDVLGRPEGTLPLHEPEFSGDEWDMVKDTLDAGWVSSVGKYVDRFEQDVAAACGTRFGVAMVNGTAALQVALIVAGVARDDEVLMPSLSFVATANAALHAGAVPHFVDVAPDTLGLDPRALAAHLEEIAEHRDGALFNRHSGRRISAVVPMHCFGIPVEMDTLAELADRFGLVIVEDAAESLGSLYKGRPCGSLGRVAALSFNGNKILTTGGGGALVTDDEALARHAKHLSTTAKLPHRWAFDHDEAGFNYRLPNINAALGCAQLLQLDDRLARKRRLADIYAAGFAGFEGATIHPAPADSRPNNWLNTLLLDPGHAAERDTVLDRLNADGLLCRPVWTPLHQLPYLAGSPRAPLDVTRDLASRIISLPSSAGLAGQGAR